MSKEHVDGKERDSDEKAQVRCRSGWSLNDRSVRFRADDQAS
jgi:hypothetical protein